MKRTIVTFFSLILFVSLSPLCSNAENEFPSWLEGTLFVSMSGSNNPDELNPFNLKKYACLYNFEQNTFSTIEIPKDARLSKNLGENNQPILISHDSVDYSENLGWGSHGRWNSFSISSYCDQPDSQFAGDFFYGLHEIGVYSQDGTNYFTDYGEGITLGAPVQILDIKGPDFCIYYLEYGISENSEIEIQFVCSQKNSKKIIDHFPIDYPWGKWAYAISSNGNVAYTGPDLNQIIVFTENGYAKLSGSENTRLLAWRNDCELLLFTNTDLREDKTYLLSYNIHTKELKNVLNSHSDPFYVENAFFCDMDVNQQLDCLAFSCIFNPNGDSSPQIGLVSLKENKYYHWNPCSLQGTRIEREIDVFTNKPITSEVNYGYSVSDDGIYIFEPYSGTDLELVWYADVAPT